MLKNRERVLISLPPELKQWTAEEAAKAGTSVAKFVEAVLEQQRTAQAAPRAMPQQKTKERWF